MCFTEKYSPQSGAHPWYSKFSGGSSITNEGEQTRLDAPSWDFQNIQSNVGTTSNRPICQQTQCTDTEVLLLDPGSRGGGNQRVLSELGENEFVGEPTMDFTSTHLGQAHPRQSNDDFSCPLLEISSMVPSITESTDFSTGADTVQERNVFRTESSRKSPSQPKWRILVCRVSGLGIKRKVFRQKLLTFSYHHWIQILQRQYPLILGYGYIGVEQDPWIPLLAI